jgi:hypothetical protein
VRRHVLAGLYRDLQRVLDEPALADVRVEKVEPRQRAQLAHARLDDSELLPDEIFVRHADRFPTRLRYSRQMGCMSK